MSEAAAPSPASRRPVLRATSITIGTPRPHELADFYARLLGYRRTGDDPPSDDGTDAGWAQLSPPEGEPGMRLNFEEERRWSPPVWPAVAGRQVATQHLDVKVEDLDAAVDWALEQGATLADPQPQDDVRVMLDPDGHPFCLFL